MSGFIKIRAKELLLGNTIRLFFVSFTAFLLKVISSISLILLSNAALISPFLQNLVIKYNSFLIYFIYSLIVVTLYLLLFLFISGLKMGEKAIYYMQSKNSNAKLKYLFIFLRPSQSFRAFYLNLKLFILKVLWFLYFFSAPVFCLSFTIFLYINTSTYTVVLYTLIIGTATLTSISLFYYNCLKARYSYAFYYLCTDLKLSVNEAIEKSINHSDNFIKDGVILKSSFLPWIFSCLLVFPVFYVIPFFKLSGAKFITFTDGLRFSLPQNLCFPYLDKKSNRIF